VYPRGFISTFVYILSSCFPVVYPLVLDLLATLVKWLVVIRISKTYD